MQKIMHNSKGSKSVVHATRVIAHTHTHTHTRAHTHTHGNMLLFGILKLFMLSFVHLATAALVLVSSPWPATSSASLVAQAPFRIRLEAPPHAAYAQPATKTGFHYSVAV